jgi:DNA-directed RNA polymerase subunit RPC12/RpoP
MSQAGMTVAKCAYCGADLTQHQRYAGTVCGNWQCRERLLDSRLLAYRAEAARAVRIENPEYFPITLVPHWSPALEALAREDRTAMSEFLHSLTIQEPIESDNASCYPLSSEDPPGLAADLGGICGVCRGYCCLHGAANHAFLDRETLLRAQRKQPGLDFNEVIAWYLDHLPSHHFRDGCLYQGEKGCVLPRAMRANICNGYECRGLRMARERFDSVSDRRSFVVVRHDNHIHRAAFIDDDGKIRHHPPDFQ